MSKISIYNKRQDAPIVSYKTTQELPLEGFDLETVAMEINLYEKAAELAENELPPSDAVSRISDELAIDDRIQKIITKNLNWTVPNVENIDMRIRDLKSEVQNKVSEVRLFPIGFKQRVIAELQKKEHLRKDIQEEYLTQKEEYMKFRKRNGLTYPMDIPESNFGRWNYWLIIAFWVLVDGICNASFFGMSNEMGLLGGFFQAGALAVVNTGVMCFLGYAFGVYILHINAVKKTMGWLSVALSIFVALFIAFMIAHYREMMENTGGTMVRAFASFVEHPFYLESFSSWILLGVTLFIGGVAWREGYRMRGYPGYKRKQKNYNVVSKIWMQEQYSIRKAITKIKNEYLNRLAVGVKQCRNVVQTMRKEVQSKDNLIVTYQNARQSATKLHQGLIGLFRDTNRKLRQTPAPRYFDNYDDIDMSYLPLPIFENRQEQLERIDALRRRVESLANDMDRIQQEIMTAYTRYCETIQVKE